MQGLLWLYMNFQWVQFSHSVVSDSLWPHGLQYTRLPCPSPSPGICPRSCLLNWRCCATISSSVTLFSFCLQSFPESGSFTMSWLLVSGGQSIGASASASVFPKSNQGWFPLRLTGLISLLSKGLCMTISRWCIKNQRHHFANKGPYSKSYGFSSSHVWMDVRVRP